MNYMKFDYLLRINYIKDGLTISERLPYHLALGLPSRLLQGEHSPKDQGEARYCQGKQGITQSIL